MSETVFHAKPLTPETWPDFASLAEAHKGVWGGCWCMWYHGKDKGQTSCENRRLKEQLVRAGKAHASLVFQEDTCVGWCQFGSPTELPRIHNQRAYRAAEPTLPDWRITCLFIGKGHRGKGATKVALMGAIEQITQLGGGRVEAYPDDTAGRRPSAAFLFNGTLKVFEQAGFERFFQIGKHKWVVRQDIG